MSWLGVVYILLWQVVGIYLGHLVGFVSARDCHRPITSAITFGFVTMAVIGNSSLPYGFYPQFTWLDVLPLTAFFIGGLRGKRHRP